MAKKELSRENIKDIYTLSPMQEGMFFHSLYEDASQAYFEHVSYRFCAEFDAAIIEKSLNELFKRYDILRTVFIREKADRMLQVVLKVRAIDFYYEDISTRKDKEDYLRRYKEKDKRKLFDLGKDVLMRLAVFRTGKKEYEFSWSFHHILMDGWCLGILSSEFLEIYNSLLEGKPPRLPAVRPYRVFIEWLENQDKERTKTYWKSYLEGYEEAVSVPRWKWTRNENCGKDYRRESVTLVLDREEYHHLNQIAAANKATFNTLFQAAWGILLGKYNGKRDVVFGIVVSGRPANLEGVESMVGLFINTIPVRVQFENHLHFHQLLREMQEKAIQSEPYHYYPLADIQAETIPKQHLIDHIMVFENYPLAQQIEKSMDLELVGIEIFEQTNYDFNISAAPAEQLTINLKYNANFYQKGWVQIISKHLKQVLLQIIDNHRRTIETFTLLSEEEKQQVLLGFNRTPLEYPVDKAIHELFLEQAEQDPDHVALAGPKLQTGRPRSGMRLNAPGQDISITYKDLNRKSHQLAYLLRGKGVMTDSIVGLMAKRSSMMIVGILAILKAGGAYLPIDPDCPGERIRYMLSDSNSNVLVTTP